MKRKYLIIILLPLLMLSFLSVGYAQLSVDTSIISMSGMDWSLKVDSTLASSIDSRNTPYMTAKSATEKELFLELATLEDCKSGVVQFKIDITGLTAYKQLPLTQEEIDAGSFRPKNVENSFALFDNGGRKVAHIYGSKITDAKGVEVWLDQDLENGLLTVYLPKPEVLATLSFPLLLDPTFGYSTIGASAIGYSANASSASLFTLPVDATATAIYGYLIGYSGANVTFAIYNSTFNLMGVSDNIVASGSLLWNRADCSIVLDAGDYYIAVIGNNNYDVKYDSGSTDQTVYQLQASYAFPSTFSSSESHDWKLSLYAEYTATSTPTPSPSYTPFPEGDMSNTDWWISILVLLLIIINIFLMMLPFALVRFTFGILSLFLCMLALSYQVPLSPYLQTAGLLISALAMLFSVRARE